MITINVGGNKNLENNSELKAELLIAKVHNYNQQHIYHANDACISLAKINNAIHYCISDLKDINGFIICLNSESHSNIISDFAALRKYDYNSPHTINNKPIYYVSMSELNTNNQEKEAYVLALSNKDLIEKTVKVNINDVLDITYEKELDKIPIVVKEVVKIINIVNY